MFPGFILKQAAPASAASIPFCNGSECQQLSELGFFNNLFRALLLSISEPKPEQDLPQPLRQQHLPDRTFNVSC